MHMRRLFRAHGWGRRANVTTIIGAGLTSTSFSSDSSPGRHSRAMRTHGHQFWKGCNNNNHSDAAAKYK
jgi:hypothetical protein